MKRLAEFFEELMELYNEGIVMINESWKQIAHITCIMGVLMVLWINPERFHSVCWTAIMAVYLIMLAVVGYCKFWDVGANENNREKIQSMYTKIYVVGCVLLTAIGCVFSGIIQTVIVVGVIVALSALFYTAGEVLISTFIYFDGKKNFFEKIRDLNPTVYATVYMCLVFLMFFIPINILEMDPMLRLILVAIYAGLMPIVALLADNGFDIEAIFD